MRITHETRFASVCPVDGSEDIYDLAVECDRTIPVEEVLEALKVVREKGPMFQEDITEWLAARLRTTVTTVGFHSGVKTTVTA